MFHKAIGFGLGFAAGWAGPEWVMALLASILVPEVAGTVGALARRVMRQGWRRDLVVR